MWHAKKKEEISLSLNMLSQFVISLEEGPEKFGTWAFLLQLSFWVDGSIRKMHTCTCSGQVQCPPDAGLGKRVPGFQFLLCFYVVIEKQQPWTLFTFIYEELGLPWWLRWWRTCLQCRRPAFSSWVGKIPWWGRGKPLQCSCLGNPTDAIAGGLQSLGSQRHHWATNADKGVRSWFGVCVCVLSLVGYSPWGLRVRHDWATNTKWWGTGLGCVSMADSCQCMAALLKLIFL